MQPMHGQARVASIHVRREGGEGGMQGQDLSGKQAGREGRKGVRGSTNLEVARGHDDGGCRDLASMQR